MNYEWSLDVLYKGLEDPNYLADKRKLTELTEEINKFSQGLASTTDTEQSLLQAITYLEDYRILGNRLGYYLMLRQSVNTSDAKVTNEQNVVEKSLSESSKAMAIIQKWIAKTPNLDVYINKHDKLKAYEYLLQAMSKEAKHLLSDDVEEIIAKLNISAGSAWGSMQSYLTSTVEVEYRGENITLSQVRNLAYSEDPQIRKDAYEAELKAYEKIKDPISYSLNNIKTQVNTICDLRGYESPLDLTLEQSKMKKTTLDAMFSAIKEYLPVFHKYLKHKAKLLGHENGLPWYDLFAPLGESNKNYTVEEAREYLLNHFGKFSSDLADMVQTSFDDNWIDFYPRKGKVGGAFCENIPFLKQSRIMTNFTGSLSDVITLAHELGHAYHGLNIEDHLPLNTDYSMPVAETASTFNESLIMEAAIAESSGSEKMALIESQLQDLTQIICDIYSRYLFESEVFEKSKNGFLFADELSEIMLGAQKEAYGDGLDHSTLHPYMWVIKGHYYSENLSFYNFPYAFGGLFARGLYMKYKQEGQVFVATYKALLHATTVRNAEDVAKEANINIEDPEFWRSSLKTVEALVEQFITLS